MINYNSKCNSIRFIVLKRQLQKYHYHNINLLYTFDNNQKGDNRSTIQ